MLLRRVDKKLPMSMPIARKNLCWSAAVAASTISAIAGLTFLPASAVTLSYTGTGTGGSIPDNKPLGIDSTITVPASSNMLITDITVTLNNLVHTSVGQLRALLTYVPTNTTVSLFNRVGRVSTGAGDSSNFNGNYSFNDAFTGDLWAVAASGDNNFNIPGGNYYPTGANSSTLVPMLNLLSGDQASGQWRLNIADLVIGNTNGSFGGWTLNLEGEPIPEPLTILGTGVVLGAIPVLKKEYAKRSKKKNNA